VTWTSSDPEYVSVDANGIITALKTTVGEQTIIISVITRDGNKVDTCEVRVLEHLLAFVPQNSGLSLYTSNQAELDLSTFVLYDTSKITFEDINFEIESDTKYARIENGILKFNTEQKGKPFKLTAKVNNGTISVETVIFLKYVSQ